MLRSTFQHIAGIGEKTEKELWDAGCTSWDLLLDGDYGLPPGKYRRLKAGILESKSRLDALDHKYFREALGGGLSWRAYENFREHACFIDIETTGLSPYLSHVTTVCIHSGTETKSYVSGKNMDELSADLEKYKYVVSFNGARFDLPFLSSDQGLSFDQIHLDLLYPLRNLGYRGGLKRIEQVFNISRETAGVTGFDAVRLWSAYKNDRTVEVAGCRVRGDEALDLLVRYNRDDTVNLEKLAELTVKELRKKHMPQ